jgi:hypothetical protein
MTVPTPSEHGDILDRDRNKQRLIKMVARVDTYFSIEGVAKYWGYAEKTIRKWVFNREIPFHNLSPK